MGSPNFSYDDHLNVTYISEIEGDLSVDRVKKAIEAANEDLKYGKLMLRYGYHKGFGIYSTLKINERYKYTGEVEGSIEETTQKLLDDRLYVIRSAEAKILDDEELDTTEFLKKVIKDLIEGSDQYGLIKKLDAQEMLEHAIEYNKKADYDLTDWEGREDLIADAFGWKFWHEACLDAYYELIETMDEAAKNIAVKNNMIAL